MKTHIWNYESETCYAHKIYGMLWCKNQIYLDKTIVTDKQGCTSVSTTPGGYEYRIHDLINIKKLLWICEKKNLKSLL